MQHMDIPPVEFLILARKQLAEPGPNVQPTPVRVNAGPNFGTYSIRFVSRQYSSGKWVWEIDSSERL